MVRVCVFPGCGNKMKRFQTETFHRLPLRYGDRSLVDTWLLRLNINIETPTEKLRKMDHRVCSAHFDKDDFVHPKRAADPKNPKKVSLKKNALPRLQQLAEKIKKHELSKIHMDSCLRFSSFGRVNIATQVDEGFRLAVRCNNDEVSPLQELPRKRDIACQTDPPHRRTVRTQLSLRTLHKPYRSTAVQTTDSSDFDVWTSDILQAAPSLTSISIERPSKRPRVDPEKEEEEEEEEDGSFSVVASDELDDTCDPAEITYVTEETDMSGQIHTPPYNIKTYIVYETCIMELFEMCPVCQRLCDVRTRRMGTFLSVEQLCPHCQFSRLWNSQPIVRSIPAGNLQLSTSVYVNGEPFFKLEKVLKAINLQLFEYDTFLRHAKMFIEPAIMSKFKTSQGVMLRRLSEEDKVIPGGDVRADSPVHFARSGSHTTMDLNTNNVVDIPLVQSDEGGRSYQTEKEGLERGLALLQEHGCIDDLMALIFDEDFVDPAPFTEETLKITIKEEMCAPDEQPEEGEAIDSFVTQVKIEAV